MEVGDHCVYMFESIAGGNEQFCEPLVDSRFDSPNRRGPDGDHTSTVLFCFFDEISSLFRDVDPFFVHFMFLQRFGFHGAECAETDMKCHRSETNALRF